MNWHQSLQIFAIVAAFSASCLVCPLEAQPPILEIQTTLGADRGMPIVWNDRQVVLLRTDGSLSAMDRNRVQRHRTTREPFQPISIEELQNLLVNELGRELDVRVGGHYIIVARKEISQLWDKRFEMILRQCQQFFSIRGLSLDEPSFPLVAIVFRNRAEFKRYADQEQVRVSEGTLGYYSPNSNRMVLFEQSEGAQNWFSTSTTILHEAVHQIAYNAGLHRRITDTPVWLVEGLASMFEAPGMMETRSAGVSANMINQARWQTWKNIRSDENGLAEALQSLIVQDELFKRDPDRAYAISWAISFYLSERQSNRYLRYLTFTANRGQGVGYSPGQRSQDFQQCFEIDPLLLVRNTDRFLTEVAGR